MRATVRTQADPYAARLRARRPAAFTAGRYWAVPRTRFDRVGQPWTRIEDFFLAVRHQRMTVNAMAAKLHRKPNGVRARMKLKGF